MTDTFEVIYLSPGRIHQLRWFALVADSASQVSSTLPSPYIVKASWAN